MSFPCSTRRVGDGTFALAVHSSATNAASRSRSRRTWLPRAFVSPMLPTAPSAALAGVQFSCQRAGPGEFFRWGFSSGGSIIDDFGMRKLPHTAAEDLLEIIMRRYERASTLLTSNRPVEDWGKLLGDVAAVTAMLDRLLHHGHVLKCGPRSWRTKVSAAATSVAVVAPPTNPTQEAS